MTAIRINVNKQMDGYAFSIAPSVRMMLKKLFPTSQPATNIFVRYDTQTDFEGIAARLENNIYPALLGIENEADVSQLDEILFVDTQTGNIIQKLVPGVEKV